MSNSTYSELRRTILLSIPITIGLLCHGLFGIIDSIMIGNILGERALAAANLGNNITWAPLLFTIGISSSIPVLTAQAIGAQRRHQISNILRHGLFTSLVFSLLGAGLVCVFVYGNGLSFLGQPPELSRDTINYSCIIALSIPFASIFQSFKYFHDTTGTQWLSLFWTLAGLVANIILNWIFMTGAFIVPALGVEGAALGTFLARLFSMLGLIFHKRVSLELKKGLEIKSIQENLKIGFPCSLHIIFEAGLFLIAPFFMGWISTSAIAANQVASAISGTIYTLPLGISQALSIRIGEAYGRRDRLAVKRIFKGITWSCMGLMSLFSIALICGREELPALFNLESESSQIAESILVVAGAYVLFDTFQVLAAGTLRGLSDVKIIASSAFVCYWLIGCPVALYLGFPAGLSCVGIWIGLAAGLASISFILGYRIFRKHLCQNSQIFGPQI